MTDLKKLMDVMWAALNVKNADIHLHKNNFSRGICPAISTNYDADNKLAKQLLYTDYSKLLNVVGLNVGALVRDTARLLISGYAEAEEARERTSRNITRSYSIYLPYMPGSPSSQYHLTAWYMENARIIRNAESQKDFERATCIAAFKMDDMIAATVPEEFKALRTLGIERKLWGNRVYVLEALDSLEPLATQFMQARKAIWEDMRPRLEKMSNDDREIYKKLSEDL